MIFHLLAGLIATAFTTTVWADTPGCGKAPSTIKAGLNTVTVNGKARQWTLTLPSNYDNTKPHKLIFGVHWLGGTMNDVVTGTSTKPYYGLPERTNGTAIFVAPDGLRSGMGTGWPNTGGEDIAFIQEILKATDANLCINEKLRFSLGFSYGGGMSHSIACSFGNQFRAVAVLSGALLSGCAAGSTPVAYYGQHGLSDNVLPIASGRQIRDTFVQRNGCTRQEPREPTTGSQQRVLTKYEGCQPDKPVWWQAFDGPHTPVPLGGKETTFTYAAVWEFFSQFT